MAEKIKILLKHFNPSKVNTTYRCICSKAYNSPHGRPQPLTDACNPIAVYLFKDNFLNFYSLKSRKSCKKSITSTEFPSKKRHTRDSRHTHHTRDLRRSLCKLSFFYLCLVLWSFQGLEQPPK